MATHDYIISNASGAAVRADLNNALAAIVSNNSNATSPATTYAYQWWADTTTGQLKLRNSANSAWITIFELDGTMLMEDGSLAAPGLAFASDLDTGFSRSAANKINFSTGGAERLEIGSSEVVFNDPSNDVDFRVESNSRTHMIFVDAGNDAVGIGTSVPRSYGSSVTLATDNPSADNTFTIAAGTSNNASIHFADGLSGDDANRGIVKYEHNNNAMAFSTNAIERLRIDSSGRLLIGVSSSRSVGFAHTLQIEGTDAATSTQSFVRNSNDSSGPQIDFAKTRGTSTGSNTVVQDNDTLGTIKFRAADGTDTASTAAEINGIIDGTPGSNDTPGSLLFKTCADGASSPTERVRIDSSGRVGIGTTATQQVLTIDVNDSGTTAASFNGINIANTNTTANNGSAITFGQTISANSNARIGVIQTARGPSESQEMFFGLLGSGTYSERMRLDSSGRLLIGGSSAISGSSTNDNLQLINSAGSILSIASSDTTISSGTRIGEIEFWGQPGSTWGHFASITVKGDASAAANDNPGRIQFSTTADGATTPTERMRIDSSGNVGINQAPTRELSLHSPNNNNSFIHFTNDDTGETASDGALVGIDGNEDLNINNQESGKNVIFRNNGERMRIDSNGKLLVGATSARTSWNNQTIGAGILQVERSGNAFATAIAVTANSGTTNRTSAVSGAARLLLGRSTGTSVGSNTIVASGDVLGDVSFQGNDGSGFVEAAAIQGFCAGTPGADDMPGRLVFRTTGDGASSSSERAQIDHRGQTTWKSDGTASIDHVFTTVAGSSSSNKLMSYRRNAASGVSLGSSGDEVCVIRRNGDLDNTNNSYGALSDIKLKENVVDANSQWEDVKNLRVRNYNFKAETGNDTHTQLGLIAQEVETVSPGLVSETLDLDAGGNDLGTTTKSVSYSVLYMKAVKALQEAMDRIETLEAKVAALEAG